MAQGPVVNTVKKDAVLDLTVDSLALGGAGVARAGELVVFVSGGYPGERVRARVIKRTARWAEATLVEVLEASPDRRTPRCVHFGAVCGGCRAQDLAYPAQVAAKTQQVKETLARLGGLPDVPVADCVPSPETWHYRNKMEFSFQPDQDGAPILGLHVRQRFDTIFDLVDCSIASPLTNRVVHATRDFARAAGWTAYHPRRHTGLVRFLTVRHLPTTGQAAVHLVAARDDVPAAADWAEALAALDPAIKSVALSVNDGQAHVAFGERTRILWGAETIEERLLGLSFEASPNAFLQTNSRQAEALYAAALEEAALTGTERVLDVYCGAGTIALVMARAAREVVGIESVEPAVADARRNAAKNGIANARFACGDARAVLRAWAMAREGRHTTPEAARVRDAKAPLDPAAYEPFAPDVVVVDPPRAGLHPRVIERIAELAPARVVYVSCNPATMARDLAHFGKHGYATTRVRPFDMFPHTPHVECVARLDPSPRIATTVGPA
jgi:23S rRNA (uracil1939-C5)-methyltransferase